MNQWRNNSPEKSELDLANERADEFENKYLRAHAEMQNIQRRANEELQLCNAIVAKIWRNPHHHLITLVCCEMGGWYQRTKWPENDSRSEEGEEIQLTFDATTYLFNDINVYR